MKILVTGGAGYIGSHTIVSLLDNGYEVISVDNFSNSNAEVFDGILEITGKMVRNYPVDLTNLSATEKIFEANQDIAGIIHFAAFKYVGESVKDPLRYFTNNLESMMNILSCKEKYRVDNLVFSSSCTVYGNPDVLPITESSPFKPAESPYGETKQICERIISATHKHLQKGNFIVLRYFNPAGQHASGAIPEKAHPEFETLVPIIREVYNGRRDQLVVFGTDYPTRDGTCIRDYIHIMDLAEAHTKAIGYLLESGDNNLYEVINLGTGKGLTILEMIQSVEKVSGKPLKYVLGERRRGDVVATYADISKADRLLNWRPRHTVDDIFKSIL